MTPRALSAVVLVVQVMSLVAVPATIALVPGNVAAAQDLDTPLGLTPEKGITGWTNAIFKFGLILVVLAAAIYIAIGAFMYFAASGNAELAKTGKDYISRAITGLVLGLIAWVILQTISPQFAKELKDPELKGVWTQQE